MVNSGLSIHLQALVYVTSNFYHYSLPSHELHIGLHSRSTKAQPETFTSYHHP